MKCRPTNYVAGNDPDYEVLEHEVREAIHRYSDCTFFTTSAKPEELWLAYLDNVPEPRRRHYDCHACRRFIERYGNLVAIDAEGQARALFWSGVAAGRDFAKPRRALQDVVETSRVTGVFISSESQLGERMSGGWSHLYADNPKPWRSATITDSQEAARLAEEHRMLLHAVADYPAKVVDEALRLLRSGQLSRSEKGLPVAEWFRKVHDCNTNQVWLEVAKSPAGFCHVRAGVVGTLFEDVKAGKPFEAIQRAWNDKMDPLQYQRPTAAPKSGAINQAEKLFDQLGLAPSLKRRYATLDDVQVKLWEPRPAPKEAECGGNGVFASVRALANGHVPTGRCRCSRKHGRSAKPKLILPAQNVTWSKFRREVLPVASTLEVEIPRGVSSFYGLVTAEDHAATPILQWDNPVSWYFKAYGSLANEWGLVAGTWEPVGAVFLPPHKWKDEDAFRHQNAFACFAIPSANPQPTDLCLFPEILRAELHGVRAVIEAHNKTDKISNAVKANACGLAFCGDGDRNITRELTIRVNGGEATYVLDRWD